MIPSKLFQISGQVHKKLSNSDSLRRFFMKVGPLNNPEYEIDISNLKITDYGNIHTENESDSLSLILKLSTKFNSVI